MSSSSVTFASDVIHAKPQGQLRASLGKLRLDRADRALQDRRDLSLGQVLEIAEHDARTLAFGEGPNGVPHQPAGLGSAGIPFGRMGRVAPVSERVDARLHGPSPDSRAAAVHYGALQVNVAALRVAETTPARERLEQCLHDHLLGPMRVAEYHVGETEHRRVVTIEESGHLRISVRSGALQQPPTLLGHALFSRR